MQPSDPTSVEVMSNCLHVNVAPVDLDFADHPVAWVCEDCLDRLPAAWNCPDCGWAIGLTAPESEAVRTFVLRKVCAVHAVDWDGD